MPNPLAFPLHGEVSQNPGSCELNPQNGKCGRDLAEGDVLCLHTCFSTCAGRSCTTRGIKGQQQWGVLTARAFGKAYPNMFPRISAVTIWKLVLN